MASLTALLGPPARKPAHPDLPPPPPPNEDGSRKLALVIANSQWPLVDDNGKLAAEDKLQDPVVLKIKLEAR